MGIEIKDGKLKISASYSLKVPAAQEYSSQDAYAGVSVEYDVEGDISAIIEQAPGIHANLSKQAKLAVFSELGLGFVEEGDGTLSPKLVAKAPAPAAPAPAASSAPFSTRGNSGGGGGFGPPKADVSLQPTFVADFGGGAQQYYDLRSLKADGTFKPGAADFRPVVKGGQQVWLYYKDGNVNQKTADALTAAGVDF